MNVQDMQIRKQLHLTAGVTECDFSIRYTINTLFFKLKILIVYIF